MEALKIKAIPVDGKLTVAVPHSLNNIEVEVIVLAEEKFEKYNSTDQEERAKRMMLIVGTAKDWDKTFDKHDVYEQ
jgi:hypothetical protein